MQFIHNVALTTHRHFLINTSYSLLIMFMDLFRASLRQTSTLHHKVYVESTLLHKFCPTRPSTDHHHRLLTPGVAGKGKDHCHGNQCQGGKDEEVRAVLAY